MEETIGLWWHRAITHAADRRHPQAAVALADLRGTLRALFRAAGGDATVRVAEAQEVRHGGARGWLQRVAGTGQRADTARREADVLALPATLAVFDDVTLNRDLYIWLAALGAHIEPGPDWIGANLAATQRTLQRFPGLAARHARLLQRVRCERPALQRLRGAAREAEAAVQAALDWAARAFDPLAAGSAPSFDGLAMAAQGLSSTGAGHAGTPGGHGPAHKARATAAAHAPPAPAGVAPVWLWVDGAAAGAAALPGGAAAADPGSGDDALERRSDPAAEARRRRAERVQEATERHAMVMCFRAESLLTWGEFVRVNRATDDDDNPDAARAADDMERLAITERGEHCAARVRFDLDLPSAAADDEPLGDGERLPEWDWRRQALVADHCAVQVLAARQAGPFVPTPALRATARRVRRRMEILRAAPRWQRACRDGDDLDLDAWVRLRTQAGVDTAEGGRDDDPPVHRRRVPAEHSLATLLMADLSMSTDAHVKGTEHRVIDVIRDALYVVGEALAAGSDAFEVLGFSSVKRQHVRIQHLKGFDEPWGAAAQARIGAVKPGFYTRMGAAVRHATRRLAGRDERQRLLLLLTDGKPNDLDIYEGRYGLEDTRRAVQEARAAGIVPFAVTIDPQGHDWLPYLFGRPSYVLLHQPQQLAERLAQVVATLVRR